jgi:hypothetical protein
MINPILYSPQRLPFVLYPHKDKSWLVGAMNLPLSRGKRDFVGLRCRLWSERERNREREKAEFRENIGETPHPFFIHKI